MTVDELRAPTDEFWATIDGWSQYEVSLTGKVRHIVTKRLRAPFADAEGYMKVTLCKAKQKNGTPQRVHRLVASAFLGDMPEGQTEVNHIDGNRANNACWNLEWVSPKENISHSMRVLDRRRKSADNRRKNREASKRG